LVYAESVRFKNFSSNLITVPYKAWRHPQGGHLAMNLIVEPGVSEEFDPDDPVVQLLLKAHPELRPFVVPSAWDKILEGIL
jgi:hypothetical protein